MQQQSNAATENKVEQPLEIKVYQHSLVFYWWSVWSVGFINRKLELIQRLSAMSPEHLSDFAKPTEAEPKNSGE